MDIISPIIRITSAAELRPIKLFQDWEIDEDGLTVLYRPAGLLFAIAHATSAPVPIEMLSARLVHSCQAAELPDAETLTLIGQDALHAFFLASEMCQEADDDQIPF
jgi:hypothetical protein